MEIILNTTKSLYKILNDNLDIPVYSHVPKSVDYPYLRVADITCTNWSFEGGYKIVSKIEYFSDQTSSGETIEVMDRIFNILKDIKVEITDTYIEGVNIEQRRIKQLRTGLWQGVMDINIWLQTRDNEVENDKE